MPAIGEQQVKLQSGATLVGDVSMNGATLVVDVDGAKIEVPFNEVASVTPVAAGEKAQAQQLLLKGLESQILSEGKGDSMGVLAEAHRLASEDPHVAFWYARNLLDAGYGKGASDVFEPQREAIVAAYPGIADRLANQIEERIEIENLPAALVKRLDEIAAAAKNGSAMQAENLAYAAYFRLVDQAEQPIGKSAFRIECTGQDEILESYPDGYYLYTFRRQRSFPDNPCRMEFAQTDLVGDAVEFRGSFQGAENLGVIRVKRLSDVDRRPVVVRVSDPEGKPLAGATVTFSMIGRSGVQGSEPAVTTIGDGAAKLNLFPNDYSCQVTLPRYAPIARSIVVPADAKQAVEVDVQLDRAIVATAKVVWRSKAVMHPGMPQFQDDAVTTGEFELQIGHDAPGAFPRGHFGRQWVQLVQTGEEAKLQFFEQMTFPQADASWIGRWRREAGNAREDSSDEADVDVFDMLDLAQLDAIKNEIKLELTNFGRMPGRGAPVVLPLEEGDIYLGRLSAQDPQFGRPAIIEFKILAVEVKRP